MTANLGTYMQSLYEQFGLLPGISIELHKELLAIRVENAKATATVFLQGAQLSHYQRHTEPPIIWCSKHCDYREGAPLRGGIPVCWPWFGQLEKNPQALRSQFDNTEPGAHGFVRNRHWQLDDIQQRDEDNTTLILSLTINAGDEASWPFATTLTMQFDIGATLQVTLTVHNRSDRTYVFSGALHSYFAVSAIGEVILDRLDGLEYIDCLQGWSRQRQQGTLSIDREVDRIYHGTDNPITLIDSGWQRTIEISSQGSNSAVIWNPWIDKSRRLSQFADDDYQSMLCIETANADSDIIELAPSGQHKLSVSITGHSLS